MEAAGDILAAQGRAQINQLQRNLGRITHRTLAKTMRETEADGLVNAGITVRFLRALTIGLRRSELHLPSFCRWSDGPSATISRRQSTIDGAKRGVRLNKR
jgi:DNA-binding HxlR family transcriptional regulator